MDFNKIYNNLSAEPERFDRDEKAGPWFSDVVSGVQVPPRRQASEYLKAMKSWTFACVTAIADEIAKVNFNLKRVQGKDEITLVNHPVLELLYKVNEYTTMFDFLWLVAAFLELTGEAPVFVDRGATGMGKPTGLYLLKPSKLTVVSASEGDNVIGGYKYMTPDKGYVTIPASQVLFFKYPDPDNNMRGLGTLQAAAKSVDVDEWSLDYNRSYFKNSARPDMIIKAKGSLTPEQRKQIKQSTREFYEGRENAFRTMVLGGNDFDVQPFSTTPKDMDFKELRLQARDEILGIFRVPRTVLGITDDVNRANAEATDYVFAKRTIEPKLRRIFAQLNEFLIPMMTSEPVYLDFEDIVPRDELKDIDVITKQLSAGMITINEARQMRGMESIGESGDSILIPMNLQTVDALGKTDEQSKPSTDTEDDIPDDTGDDDAQKMYRKVARTKAVSRHKHEKEQLEQIAKTLLPKARELVMRKHKAAKPVKKQADVVETVIERTDQHKAFWDAQIKLAEAQEVVMKKKVSAFFALQKKKVLNRFPQKAIDPQDYTLNAEEEAQVMENLLRPTVMNIIAEEGRRAMAFVGRYGFDSSIPVIQNYMKDHHSVFVGINDETNKKIVELLAEGVGNGDSPFQMRRSLTKMFDDMSKRRAENIARTETSRAVGFATEQGYEQSGVVAQKEWLTAFDERTCPYCESMNGKTVDIGDNYFSSGDSIGSLNFKEAVKAPPLHPSCRCALLPVIQRKASNQAKERLDRKEKELEQREAEVEQGAEKVKELTEKLEKAIDEKQSRRARRKGK